LSIGCLTNIPLAVSAVSRLWNA